MPALHIITHGGKIEKGVFSIEFTCEPAPGGQPPFCPVMRPAQDANVALTLLHAPSGSGKTSFLECLHRRIDGDSVPLDFRLVPESAGVNRLVGAIIPQKPPMVRHWKVGDLFPSDDDPSLAFLSALFSNETHEATLKRFSKRLGQHSGGQQMKIYAASALAQLLTEQADSSFLLLDETFDGLGAAEACRSLSAIIRTWLALTDTSLHVLMVTHLDDADVSKVGIKVPDASGQEHNIACLRLTLSVLDEREMTQKVRIRNNNA